MNPASDVSTTDRAAAAPRAATPAPPRASLASARAELFARTFAVWRLRAETGQGTGASDTLSATAADAASMEAARDTARHEAARTEDAHRAWRDMISQAAAPAQAAAGADLSAAFAMAPVKSSPMRPRDDATSPSDAASASDATTRRHDAGDRDAAASSHDAGTLDPALRDRLDRVMARMEQAGHTVTITETSRTQARQDALYAQGRTAPGSVVTWTRQSRHLDGLAVDVQVDGSWNSPDGYALLGKFAKEEGLSTLGARDPGHLELRVEDALSSLDQIASIKEAHVSVEEGASRAARVAQVAAVARVAPPAGLARVATVAAVAASAAPSTSAITNRPHAPSTDANSVLAQGRVMQAHNATSADLSASPLVNGANAVGILAAAANSAASGTSDGAFGQSPRGQRDMASVMRAAGVLRASGVNGARGAAPMSAASVLAGVMGPASGAPFDGSAPVLGMRGATSALRADQVASLLEARDRQPVSSMLLTVDDEGGGVDRIRVDVRGARVGAEILFGAAGDATQAATRVSELARALEQRGLAPDALRVANAAATTTDLARAAAPATERGHTTASRQDDGGRTPQDQPRHRSRREQGDHR